MSPRRKGGDQATGTVHRKTRQAPTHQHDPEAGETSPRPAKPDFDEKDAGIKPTRKAPGPAKPRHARSRSPASKPGRRPPNPEAQIEEDDDDPT